MSISVFDKGYEMDFYDDEVNMVFESDYSLYLIKGEGELLLSESMFMDYYYDKVDNDFNVENLVDEGQY